MLQQNSQKLSLMDLDWAPFDLNDLEGLHINCNQQQNHANPIWGKATPHMLLMDMYVQDLDLNQKFPEGITKI